MMTDLLNYIVWQPDLEAFRLGPIAVRWYGLMWIIGLALAYLVVQRLYKEQKIKDELFDPLFIYCFLGILIGARLGHSADTIPARWRLDSYRLCRTCLTWWYFGLDDSPLALCPQDQTEHLDSTR